MFLAGSSQRTSWDADFLFFLYEFVLEVSCPLVDANSRKLAFREPAQRKNKTKESHGKFKFPCFLFFVLHMPRFSSRNLSALEDFPICFHIKYGFYSSVSHYFLLVDCSVLFCSLEREFLASFLIPSCL